MAPLPKHWTPQHWASLRPFGIGLQRPNNYLEVWKALAENRDQLGYAWRILNEGVCDGCALGTTGLKDWTVDSVHLCNIRLRLLRLNTMPAFDPALLADIAPLRFMSSAELRDLGRLPVPMIRQRGAPGFTPLSWDAALDLTASAIRATTPDRVACYMTSRGMPNESYYGVQKAIRAIGSNNIDNAARICHAPSTNALKGALGITATSCSYQDWIESELIVFIGANPANNQPVTTKYLYYAKKNGAKIVMVNAYREPGMDKYWVPSNIESAVFGTQITDRFYMVNIGGDIAFLNGALKQVIADGRIDHAFVEAHTTGFAELCAALATQSWEELEALSGASRDDMQAFGRLVGGAQRAVFVWSMGVTQHVCGEDGVRAIINLALTRGFIGRAGCGVMPIRGHSGVQGGAEMGAYTTALPGVRPVDPANAAAIGALWGFDIPATHGLTAPEMIDAAADGRLDVLLAVGGNFLEALPEPEYVRAALERTPLRVHHDIVLSSQMLVDAAETVLLLPATTRYEVPGGVTETSTERRIIFSPEVAGPRIAAARPEWEVFLEIASRVRPELRQLLVVAGTPALRAEIARVIPQYDGIQHFAQAGDQFQYGGAHLCAGWQFPTPDGRAHFSPVTPPATRRAADQFAVTTRRGKQFNTMIHEPHDMTTGAARDAIFMSTEDATRLGLTAGEQITLVGEVGRYDGRVFLAKVTPGNLQVHWPEGNGIIRRDRRSPEAGIPDYNALVRIERVAT